MIRLLLRLIRIRDFEACASCETLKQQLVFERAEKKQLTDTLINILQPKTVEAAPVELTNITPTAGTFARRRAALEERDRQQAQILKQSSNIGRPDELKNIESLEKELGVEDKTS